MFFTHLTVLTTAATTPDQLAFLDENSKLAAISHCNDITPPFNCSAGCSNFSNTTLIQVRTSNSLSDHRNFSPMIEHRFMDTWHEMIQQNESSFLFGGRTLFPIQSLTLFRSLLPQVRFLDAPPVEFIQDFILLGRASRKLLQRHSLNNLSCFQNINY